jgi:hypothetical protein
MGSSESFSGKAPDPPAKIMIYSLLNWPQLEGKSAIFKTHPYQSIRLGNTVVGLLNLMIFRLYHECIPIFVG